MNIKHCLEDASFLVYWKLIWSLYPYMEVTKVRNGRLLLLACLAIEIKINMKCQVLNVGM